MLLQHPTLLLRTACFSCLLRAQSSLTGELISWAGMLRWLHLLIVCCLRLQDQLLQCPLTT